MNKISEPGNKATCTRDRQPLAYSRPQTSKNCSIIGSDDEFKLFCWILNKSDRPFPVNIARSETVGDLQKVIKKEWDNALAGIDAGMLNLWKVSISS
ncbi:hypothetical protein L208DRAFT_1383802 [Tricholoma matsutake]|nr:hypothetical protein L208DRAFT_1383802 [Tricholoma matsutake 945]